MANTIILHIGRCCNRTERLTLLKHELGKSSVASILSITVFMSETLDLHSSGTIGTASINGRPAQPRVMASPGRLGGSGLAAAGGDAQAED